MSIRTQRSSSRFGAAAIVAVLVASLFAFASPAGARQNVAESRVSGPDRYGTAAAVAVATFPTGSNNIVLASGENFPDGLSAAGLAGSVNGPVLLTPAGGLPTATVAALATLDTAAGGAPATVHVVGGSAAVGPVVRAQLAGLGYTVNEISGANRYETAAAAARYGATVTPIGSHLGARTAIVATGENFADALAGGSLAFNGVHPILLTESASLSPSAASAITDLNISQVVVLGGTAAVSEATASAIQALGVNVIRVSGPNRYGTAAALAEALVAPIGAGGFGYETGPTEASPSNLEVVLVSGVNFADALAAGPHAGRIEAPILLTETCNLPAETSAFLTGNNDVVGLVRAIGGTAAVCEDALDAAVAAATIAAPTATVTAQAGSTTFDISFSATVNTPALDDFAITGGIDATAVTAITPGRVFRVTVDGPLVAGTVITVAGVTTPTTPILTVPTISYTVAPDITRPVPTIAASPGANSFIINWSEPVTIATMTGSTVTVTRDGVSVGAVTIAAEGPTVGTTHTTYRATLATGTLQSGDTITVPAGAGTDPSSNASLPATRNVLPDDVRPTVVSTNRVVTSTPAGIDIDDIAVTALSSGTAAGVAGNGWTIDISDEGTLLTAGTVNITVLPVTRQVTVLHNATNAQVVAALNDNAGFNTRFVAATSEPTLRTDDAGTTAGGTTTNSFRIQYSEAMRAGVDSGVFDPSNYALDIDNNGIVDVAAASDIPAAGIDNPLFPTRVTVVFVTSGTNPAPGAATRLLVSDVQDLAGNVINPNPTSIAVAGLTPPAP